MFPLCKLADKLWYLICVLIYLHCLCDLLDFKRAVYYENNYLPVDQGAAYLSICLKIDSSEYNCTSLVGEALQVCNKTRNYFKYIENDDEKKSPNDVLARYDELDLPPLFDLKFNAGKLLGKYLNFKSLCFHFKLDFQNVSEVKHFFVFEVINRFKLKSKYFLHGQQIPRAVEKIEKLFCVNFRRCNYFTVTVKQFQRKHLPAPYVSNCQHYSERKFHFGHCEPIELRSSCVQECLKARLRVSEFFYSALDNRTLKFSDNQNYDLLDLLDANYMTQCKETCSKTDCFYTFFLFYNLLYTADELLKIKVSKNNFYFYSVEYISSFEFWLKFFGLVLLFTRISFLSLILRLNHFARVHLKEKHLVSLAKIVLWVGLLSGVYYGCYSGKQIYREFVEKSIFPYLFVQVPFEPAAFSHAVCRQTNSTEFKALSLYEIENRTPTFDPTTIYKEQFNDDFKELNFTTERVFLSSSKRNRLEQCFTFDVSIQEPRYRSLLSLTALVVNLTDFKLMFFDQYNKSFTTRSQRLEYRSDLLGEEVMNLDCTDYQATYETCDTKQHCIDRCYIDGYLKAYKKLPLVGSVVYTDYFEAFQKRSLFFDFDNAKVNQTILDACTKKFEKADCTVSRFHLATDYEPGLRFKDNFTIGLFFLQIQVGQIMKFDLFSMSVIMMFLYAVLTGLSWPKLSHSLVNLINLVFKPQEKLNFRNLILLVSLLGSIGHTWFVLRETLIKSVEISAIYEFEFLNYNKVVPTSVICLDYNLTLDEGELLTGNLLEQKTSHLNLSYLFKEIIYYDQNAVKRHWTPRTKYEDEYSSNLVLDHFFFLNYRCHQIRYRMPNEHVRNYLINTILQVKFNPNVTHEHYLLLMKLDQTDDFSSHFILSFKNNFRLFFNAFNNIHYNQYQTLTSPRLWFRSGYAINNVTLYLSQIREEFRTNYNRSTKLIPLYKDYFDLRIDDDLFDLFNLEYIKEKEDAGLLDLNYQRTLFESLIYSAKNNETGSLSFDKTFYAVDTMFTKSEALIQNILVVAFVWFDIYIVNLVSQFLKLVSQFRMFFAIFRLKRIRKQILQIKRKIDSHFLERTSVVPILSLNNKNV